jgi:hypothetical protein
MPVSKRYFTGVQVWFSGKQTVLPELEYHPVRHLSQADARGEVEKVPLLQGWQPPGASVAANLPDTQSTQEADEIAPGASVLVPDKQERQDDAAFAFAYVPFMHKVHDEASLSAEYAPRGQAVHTDAESSEYAPEEQLRQVLDRAAPVMFEYLPAEQPTQFDEFEFPLSEE